MSLRTRLEQRNIHSTHHRIRHYLAVNAAKDGHTVAIPGTLKDLAIELGLTHEALYRTWAEMAVDGEIERLKAKSDCQSYPYDRDHTRITRGRGSGYSKIRFERGRPCLVGPGR